MRCLTNEQVRKNPRAVCWPGSDRDIVAAGFAKAKKINIRDGFGLIGFGARSRRTDRADAWELGSRPALARRSPRLRHRPSRSSQDTGNSFVESRAIHEKDDCLK